MTLLKILHMGDQENLSIIYTLPTGGDVKDFVLSKFDPVIESSEYLYSRVERDPISRRSIFSTALKRIGGSHYFFRGSWSEHKAQAIDADVLVFDELDFQKQEVKKMYEERLTGAQSKNIAYYIGTPTLPGYGISEEYEASDQMEWHIQCQDCGKSQTLEWPRNISFQKKAYICHFCRENLTDLTRKRGIWIPKYPGKEVRGYQFNRLQAPWVSAEMLIKASKDDNPKHFHNFILGLPYIEKAQQLSREDFDKMLIKENPLAPTESRKVVGIDQGNNFHVIAGHAGATAYVISRAQKFHSTDELERFLESTQPDMIVMDMYPDQHYARGLQRKYGHRKFLLVNQRDWRSPARIGEVINWDRPNGVVNLERTEALDRFMDAARNNNINAIKHMPGQEDLYDHMRNLVPDIEERFGKKKKVYKKIGKDDFAHSSNYFFVGASLLFPVLNKPKTSIIETKVLEDLTPGSRGWMKEDLERSAQSLQGSDVIVIPPKQF